MKNELIAFYTGFALVTGLVWMALEIISRNPVLLLRITIRLKPWNRYRLQTAQSGTVSSPSRLKLLLYGKRLGQKIGTAKKYMSSLIIFCMSAIAGILVHLRWVR